MLNFFRKTKGSISIMLCLVLLPMVTYSTMIIDATRLQSCKTTLQSAGDLTMNAAMSEYEQILQDMYGLFATAEDPSAVQPALENYFTETITGIIGSNTDDTAYTKVLAEQLSGLIWKSGMTDEDITNFLAMEVERFEYDPIPESSLANPMIMKSQIIDYMKYKGPVSLASNLMTKLGFLKDSAAQTDAVEKKVEYTKAVKSMGDPMKAAWEAIGESNGSMDNTYNKYAKAYNDGGYGDKQTVFNIVNTTLSNVDKISEYAVLYNNYIKFRDRAFGGSSQYYDALDISSYDSKFSTDDIDTTPENLQEAEALLINLKNEISNVIINLDVNQSTALLAEFEKGYGDVTLSYDQNNPAVISSVTFGQGAETKDYKATYGNMVRWDNGLNTWVMGSGGYWTNIDMIYENQVLLLNHVDEIAEYKAYLSYYIKIKNLYDTTFTNYENDLKNDDDYQKYLDTKNQLNKILESWYDSDNHKMYIHILSSMNNYYPYQGSGEYYAKKANNEFAAYYSLVSNLESTSKAALDAMDGVLEALDNVETADTAWKGSIDQVKDNTSQTQMKSDYDTLTEGVNREDVQALRDLVNTIHTQFSTLKTQIESVTYFGTRLCDGDFSWKTVIQNEHLQAEDDDVMQYGTLMDRLSTKTIQLWDPKSLINPFCYDNYSGSTVSSEVKPAEIIDGKKNGTTEEDPNEAFYYVLMNTYKAKGEGISETKVEDSENSPKDMVDKMNQTNGVKDGVPTAQPKKETSSPEGGKDSSPTQTVTTGAENEVGNAYSTIVGAKTSANDGGYGSVSAKGIPTSSDEKNIDSSSEAGADSLEAAKGLLEKIGELGTNLRDDVYLEEYFTEMFTCQTDTLCKPGELQLLNGYSNCAINPEDHFKALNTQNPWFGKEVEFILWGDSNLQANVTTTETYIFLVRFALNAIYAFTASDIQSFASSVATALVGWSVVLVPVVQVCITLGIALAESAWDLAQLKKGEGVVIIKNAQTFVCSPTGALKAVTEEIIDEVVDEAVESVEGYIDEGINTIVNNGKESIDDCEEEINTILKDYADDLTDSITTTIKNQMVTPIVNSIAPALSKLDAQKSNAEELITQAVDDAWVQIGENIDNMEDGTIKTLTKNFYSQKTEDRKKQLTDILLSKLNTVDVPDSEALRNDIMEKIEVWIDGYKETILAKVEERTSVMKENIMNRVDKSVDNLKSYINEEIENTAEEFTGKVKEQVSNTIADHASNIITTKDKSASGGLTLNYKEYCKIFMFIQLIGKDGETACLQRAAALIQANVKFAAENPNTSFDMTKAYTMVYVSADVKMKTLFPWAVSVDSGDGATEESVNLDFSNLGDNVVDIRYSGLNGY